MALIGVMMRMIGDYEDKDQKESDKMRKGSKQEMFTVEEKSLLLFNFLSCYT